MKFISKYRNHSITISSAQTLHNPDGSVSHKPAKRIEFDGFTLETSDKEVIDVLKKEGGAIGVSAAIEPKKVEKKETKK